MPSRNYSPEGIQRHKMQPKCEWPSVMDREAGSKAWDREREKPGHLDSRSISLAAYHGTAGSNTR